MSELTFGITCPRCGKPTEHVVSSKPLNCGLRATASTTRTPSGSAVCAG